MLFSTALLTRIKGGKFHTKLAGILVLLVQGINILYWRLTQFFPILTTKPMDFRVTLLSFDYGLNTLIALLLGILLTKLSIRGYKVVKGETKEGKEVKISTGISLKSSFILSLWNVIIFPLIVSYFFI